MWAGIVKEFTHKVMVMEPHLRSEFRAMRYEKGANLRSEFDRVRMKYVALWNASVEISNNDYCSLIIQFAPPGIANFISLLYATFKLYSRTVLKSGTARSSAESPGSSNELGKEPLTLDPELVMEIATEEWERRNAHRKSRKPQQESSNTNPGAVSSENPGSNAGGGPSRGRGRRRGRGRGGRQGDCWNCGGRGHSQDNCPSPQVAEKNKRPSRQSSRNGTKPNTKPAQSYPSSLTGSQVIANRAIFEGFSGAWTAVAVGIDEDDILDSAAEVDEDERWSA
ncbi:hypothetical protein M378DRAFT_1041860 [Amanita muscaria Koide BX008]|uniref:CCHC-type domain-containing protein n=1 Tax=Amanita muscaria (strain Koide BX008) TaxID=946122 RepID=A0A0C2SMH0_AMAMK|nr:hypothetical protein M378DRAFT_1041860 [Amanita muscaria Koide BX008]